MDDKKSLLADVKEIDSDVLSQLVIKLGQNNQLKIRENGANLLIENYKYVIGQLMTVLGIKEDAKLLESQIKTLKSKTMKYTKMLKEAARTIPESLNQVQKIYDCTEDLLEAVDADDLQKIARVCKRFIDISSCAKTAAETQRNNQEAIKKELEKEHTAVENKAEEKDNKAFLFGAVGATVLAIGLAGTGIGAFAIPGVAASVGVSLTIGTATAIPATTFFALQNVESNISGEMRWVSSCYENVISSAEKNIAFWDGILMSATATYNRSNELCESLQDEKKERIKRNIKQVMNAYHAYQSALEEYLVFLDHQPEILPPNLNVRWLVGPETYDTAAKKVCRKEQKLLTA